MDKKVNLVQVGERIKQKEEGEILYSHKPLTNISSQE